MATRKSRIDPASINLLGRKADAKKLASHAAQAGAAALPFLEKAFLEGSLDIREAAAAALAPLDARRLERLARAALKASGKKPPAKELESLQRCLLFSGAQDAIEQLVERARGEDVSAEIPPWLLGRAWGELAGKLRGLTAEEASSWIAGLGLPDSARSAPDGDACTILAAILDHAPLPVWQKQSTAQALQALGARHQAAFAALAALLDAEGVPVDLTIDALLKGDPEGSFEALAPRFRKNPAERATIARLLEAKADPRWSDEAEAMLDHDRGSACAVILKLGSERARAALVARAEASTTFDLPTRELLHALGNAREQRAAPVLLRWLERPEGEAAAPMLLTALASTAGAGDIPRIERAAARQPSRASFFAHCAQTIRERTGEG